MRRKRKNKCWNRRLTSIATIAAAVGVLVTADARALFNAPLQFVVLETVAARTTDCASRLKEFVDDLDRILDSNPSSTGPIDALLQQHFPMEKCDIDDVFKVSRQSKYFFSIGNLTKHYVVTFNNGGYFDGLGFRVGFGILKASGNSFLPYALPNKERIVR